MVTTTACRRRNVRHPGSYRRQKYCHGLCQIWLSQEGDTSRSRGAEEGSSGCCHTLAFHSIEVLERLKCYKAALEKLFKNVSLLVVYLHIRQLWILHTRHLHLIAQSFPSNHNVYNN